MERIKKLVELNGSLVRPLSIGARAVIRTGGKIYLTPRVVAIHEQSEEQIRFETADNHYHVSLGPEPAAEKWRFPAEMAACA